MQLIQDFFSSTLQGLKEPQQHTTIIVTLLLGTLAIALITAILQITTTPTTHETPQHTENNNDDQDNRVQVKIQYCDSCGFGERAEKSKTMLYDEYPSTLIKVTLQPDTTVTGNFEVFVDDALVHSKKTRNEGFFHNNARQELIVLDAIASAIEKRKTLKR